MDKYISKEAAKEAACRAEIDANYDGRKYDAECVADALDFTPTADVRPVVRGKWIFEEYELASWCTKAICSSCKKTIANNSDLAHDWGQKLFLYDYKFCPNCGADMREG